MDLDPRPAVDHRQPHARGRVVVETLGVADVLEAGGVADAALHAFAVRGVGDSAGEGCQIKPLTLTLPPRGGGHIPHSAQQLCDGDWAVQLLTGDHLAAGFHSVPDSQFDRIHPKGRRQFVHLRLVRVAVLHRAKATHRAAWRVVRVEDEAVDRRVRNPIGTAREARGVRDDRCRAGRVGAAVENDPRLDVYQRAVAAGAVLVGEGSRVTVHMADERLGA